MERDAGPSTWAAVDDYVAGLLAPSDPALTAALRASGAAGLPPIHVSAAHGQLLHVLAKASGARRILEIGTLGGYSTIFLARALRSGGVVVSLERDPKHAEVARANLEAAGLGDRVEIRLGDAHETLARMIEDGEEPFDFVFMDAEKPGYPRYLGAVLSLARSGTLIIADNVVREAAVLDEASEDENVQGARAFNALLASTEGVSATVLQTVGAKGYDGLAIAVVD